MELIAGICVLIFLVVLVALLPHRGEKRDVTNKEQLRDLENFLKRYSR